MLKECIEYKRFVWELGNIINTKGKNNNLIFLCIGTNKVVGDCLGPFVGSYLKQTLGKNHNVRILGDLKNDITYDKIQYVVRSIKNEYKNSLIIVVDSALSSNENIGKVFVQNRGLRYAESLKKQNSVIGNISIKAVVGKNSNNSIKNFKILKGISIEKIELMSNFVASGIIDVISNRCNE